MDHGIGIWRGIVREQTGEYFLIEYRGPRGGGADTLHVPTNEAERITPYIGFRTPTVTRLGTPLWHKTLKKTRDDVREFARRLLTLYASRALSERAPFLSSAELEEKVAADFPFTETPSQLRALDEILTDLGRREPMDRIVVGDVGFGKTELALRASVRVASAGKQVAILAPTTLLAAQHYSFWTSRLKNIPLEVRRLTRLESSMETKKTLHEIKEGKIDIVIGTHRLLSKDVLWKNLGLLVVDEEQRFGVSAKEHLKNLKKDLDVLTLSATPLPRTLSMAFATLRKMSVLDEAPEGRVAPQTFILPWKKELIKNALAQELNRGGQIYYVESRIRKIKPALKLISSLLPQSRVGYIHGRIGESELIQTMEDFRARKIDILVATSIIENGIDLNSVNTLLVADSVNFGLAELHQLRGRIGRGNETSHAYFFYEPERLARKAAYRLDILASTQFLGAGTIIAERDLEMRGAGNLLGREQSGVAGRVGLNLYSQYLSEEIENLRRTA